MPSPILARADALMQRRRQGETGPLDDVPVLTDTVETSIEFPTLQPQGDAPSALSPQAESTEAQIAARLAAQINERLQTVLPALIDEIIEEILNKQSASSKSD